WMQTGSNLGRANGTPQRESGGSEARTAVLGRDLAEAIHRRILDGRIPLGSWLRQDSLALEFGVSRTPIREAFRALHVQGIIEMIPHRGACVRGPTPRTLREILVLRAELEGFAAELATDRIDNDQLTALNEASERFRRMVDAPAPTGRRSQPNA